jgi:hypothetical protein
MKKIRKDEFLCSVLPNCFDVEFLHREHEFKKLCKSTFLDCDLEQETR